MKKLAIVLFTLIGCAGKPIVNNTVAKAEDDPRCEKYYEVMNKYTDINELEAIKEEAKELLGFQLNNPIDIYELSNFKELETHFSLRCNEAITCNQKSYCISILSLKINKIFPLF